MFQITAPNSIQLHATEIWGQATVFSIVRVGDVRVTVLSVDFKKIE